MDCFETKLGKFCLGDARKLIKDVPSNSVDAIVTDPPWGVGMDEFDDERAYYDLLPEMFRVLKVGGAMAVYYFVKKLDKLIIETTKAGFKYYWTLIRIDFGKTTRSPFGFSGYTPIVIFYKGEPPKIRVKSSDMLVSGEIDYDLLKGMTTEVIQQFKSTATSTFLVQTLADVNELVLDPFGGYGSIPFICETHNRRWLSFEINKERFEIAKTLIMEKRMPDLKKKDVKSLDVFVKTK